MKGARRRCGAPETITESNMFYDLFGSALCPKNEFGFCISNDYYFQSRSFHDPPSIPRHQQRRRRTNTGFFQDYHVRMNNPILTSTVVAPSSSSIFHQEFLHYISNDKSILYILRSWIMFKKSLWKNKSVNHLMPNDFKKLLVFGLRKSTIVNMFSKLKLKFARINTASLVKGKGRGGKRESPKAIIHSLVNKDIVNNVDTWSRGIVREFLKEEEEEEEEERKITAKELIQHYEKGTHEFSPTYRLGTHAKFNTLLKDKKMRILNPQFFL
ncbi:MAG: hypothetical protein ACTSUE_20415 [Promethearchaeota archaeon]